MAEEIRTLLGLEPLESGLDIILELQGTPIESLGAFRNTVALAKPGTDLSIKVQREGKEIMLTAKVGQNPEHSAKTIETEESLGIYLDPVTPELAKRYNLETKTGLLIVEIDPDGVAFASGLRAGYVILAVNGKAVSTVDDFVNAAQNAKKSGKILLQVKIGQNIRFFSLPVE